MALAGRTYADDTFGIFVVERLAVVKRYDAMRLDSKRKLGRTRVFRVLDKLRHEMGLLTVEAFSESPNRILQVFAVQ